MNSKHWWQRKLVIIPSALLMAAMGIACGSGGDDSGSLSGVAAEAEPGVPEGEEEPTSGVFTFGQTVKFKDGSTLTVGKPVTFKRDEWAGGGEDKKVFLKFKSTFTNNTQEIYDPALTDGAASAGGTEGESIYQEGLDAPENKVLPGKSVTWWMGYGFDTDKEVQLEVRMGFLEYDSVIFTS